MARSGEVDEPTKEYPEIDAGPARLPDHVGSVQQPVDSSSPGRPRAWRLVVGLGVVVAVLAAAFVVVRGLDVGLRNPFAGQRTDRSQPVLLQSIRDLSRYVAAEGDFQVVIDLQDRRDNIPEFLVNERTLFVAAGRVPAYVDFGRLADGAVTITGDGTGVEVVLPAPQLDDAVLDLERSYVFAQQRGLLNRLGEMFADDPAGQRELYLLAEQRIAAAAQGGGLAERAEDNTRRMLEGLFRALGFTTVAVTYTAP